jgi:hypothetical protein
MKQELKVNGAFKNLLNGEQVKMLTDNYKSNIFRLNENRDNNSKPIVWEILSSRSPITRYLTYDEFKEKFKDNTFIVLE